MRRFFPNNTNNKLLLLSKRRIHGLGNPMFPDRQPIVKPEIKFDPNKLPENLKKESDVFLVRHGGKVALVAFSTAIVLIYRFFKNSSMKSKFEDKLINNSPINPYEINELRDENEISTDNYNEIVNKMFQIHDSHESLSYTNFLKELIGLNKSKLKLGHVFDRIFYGIYCPTNNETRSKNDNFNLQEVDIPLKLGLVAFNLFVNSPFNERLESMYLIASDNENKGIFYIFFYYQVTKNISKII